MDIYRAYILLVNFNNCWDKIQNVHTCFLGQVPTPKYVVFVLVVCTKHRISYWRDKFVHPGIWLAFACSRIDSDRWRNWCTNYFRRIFSNSTFSYITTLISQPETFSNVWEGYNVLMLLWGWQENGGHTVIHTIRRQNWTLGVTIHRISQMAMCKSLTDLIIW